MTNGEALEAGEPFGSATAAEAFQTRTGRTVGRGLVDLGLTGLVSANAGLLFDAEVGALGDALRRAGFDRGVIANADGTEPASPPLPQYRRDAVSALVGSDGTVPKGAVGPELLQSEPAAPFGVRLSPEGVGRAFRDAWRPRSVVLVEGSDLARADAYKAFSSPAQWAHERRQALVWTDSLVAQLLTSVDLTRDAVVVVGPARPANEPALTVAAVHAPGVEPGLLQSGTTRRAGFASLVDIAPTILDLLAVGRPASMEGRPLTVENQGGSAVDRRSTLVGANRDGLFRDSLVTPETIAYIVSTILLAGAMVALGSVASLRRWLRRAALALIGLLIATTLAGPLHVVAHGGATAYWYFVISAAIAIAIVCEIGGRRSLLDPLILALTGLTLVHVVDSFTGARADFNTVFGNSAIVGIRFAGLGNMSFAQLAAAVIIVAGLLAWRVGGTRGVRLSLAILAVSLLSLVPPLWGQSFGATLAATPAFVLLGWMLLGRSVRVRTVVALGAVMVAAGLLVGFLDLLRPSEQRTHVGRFFEQVGNEGFAGFLTVIQRKAGENLSTLSDTYWILLTITILAMALYLYVGPRRPLRAAIARVPTLFPTGVALAVVVVLGYGLKDSGIAVPGMMLAVVGAAVVFVGAAFLDEAPESVSSSPQRSRSKAGSSAVSSADGPIV